MSPPNARTARVVELVILDVELAVTLIGKTEKALRHQADELSTVGARLAGALQLVKDEDDEGKVP